MINKPSLPIDDEIDNDPPDPKNSLSAMLAKYASPDALPMVAERNVPSSNANKDEPDQQYQYGRYGKGYKWDGWISNDGVSALNSIGNEKRRRTKEVEES